MPKKAKPKAASGQYAKPEASPLKAAKSIHCDRDGRWIMRVDGMASLIKFAERSGCVTLHDSKGKVVGTFTPTPSHVWDDATGTPEEDAEDIRRARLAMQEGGSISLRDFMLEDKLRA